MWPWIFFVPAECRELSAEGSEARSSLRFLLVWCGVILIFFSIPRSKLGSYVLPAIPPLAILAGNALARLGTADSARRRLGAFALCNLVVASLTAVVLSAMFRSVDATLRRDVIMALGALGVGSAIAFFVARGSRNISAAVLPAAVSPAAVLVILGGGIFFIVAIGKACNDANQLYSYRSLAKQIRLLSPGCTLASYKHHIQSLPFYTGQREVLVSYRGELAPEGYLPEARASFINDDTELQRVWAGSACVVLVANVRDLKQLSDALVPTPRLVGREGKKIALVNQAQGLITDSGSSANIHSP
jgi:4-amino-4-deoxy-L-arabinose transferase-like glycosyltransferase